MSNEQKKVISLCEGEVVLWIEQESSIHLKAATRFGDPVELTRIDALELAKALEALATLISP